MKIRCICGYGPQENHSIERKNNFWSRMTLEVENSISEDSALIIQMDGNLWAGPELIQNYPMNATKMDKCSKIFLKLLQLTVVNNLDVSAGLITRRRQTVRKFEESILDFYVVCDKMLPFLEKMTVDEEQIYVLSSFSKVKGEQVIKKSDHNPVILELFLSYTVKKPDRIETFNFRNKECLQNFFEITDKSTALTECFLKDGNIKEKAAKWYKKLRGEFHKAFRKIRHSDKKIKTPVTEKLEERKIIIKRLKICPEEEKDKLKDILMDIESQLCDIVAEGNRAKVVDNFKVLTDQTGLLSTQGMWGLKKKVFPKNRESLPFAKKDYDGKIITSQIMIKKLYLDTFIHRLRHRPIKPDFSYLRRLKEELCRRRLIYVEKKKTQPWSSEDLLKTLKTLKSNKSRDPLGLVNELFQPKVIGQDVFNSLLLMFNQVKDSMTIPSIMELCNIVAIYKGKGEKADLKNDRGIFIVNLFRALLMKLIYKDKYEIVDQNMSDSNVGARKRKNIRNHVFILNGIINEATKKKSEPVDIVVVDYEQCFDSLWLAECINDLFDAGIKDDKLALIHKMNSVNQVAVKTPFGLTERKVVEEIVLQGEVFGPLECSVSIDTFGKECLNERKHLYMYKGEVGVPPLAMGMMWRVLQYVG